MDLDQHYLARLIQEYRGSPGQNRTGHWAFPIWLVLPEQTIYSPTSFDLFVNLSQSPTESGQPVFGHYGSYVTKPFQVLGILTFVFAAAIFTLGFVFPEAYKPLRLPDGHLQLGDKLAASIVSGEVDSPQGAITKEPEYDAAENVDDSKKKPDYDQSPDGIDAEIKG
jgi:hypothetical protein